MLKIGNGLGFGFRRLGAGVLPENRFNLNVEPQTLTIAQGANGSTYVSLELVAGASEEANLETEGVPVDVTAEFTDNPRSTNSTDPGPAVGYFECSGITTSDGETVIFEIVAPSTSLTVLMEFDPNDDGTGGGTPIPPEPSTGAAAELATWLSNWFNTNAASSVTTNVQDSTNIQFVTVETGSAVSIGIAGGTPTYGTDAVNNTSTELTFIINGAAELRTNHPVEIRAVAPSQTKRKTLLLTITPP